MQKIFNLKNKLNLHKIEYISSAKKSTFEIMTLYDLESMINNYKH